MLRVEPGDAAPLPIPRRRSPRVLVFRLTEQLAAHPGFSLLLVGEDQCS